MKSKSDLANSVNANVPVELVEIGSDRYDHSAGVHLRQRLHCGGSGAGTAV